MSLKMTPKGPLHPIPNKAGHFVEVYFTNRNEEYPAVHLLWDSSMLCDWYKHYNKEPKDDE